MNINMVWSRPPPATAENVCITEDLTRSPRDMACIYTRVLREAMRYTRHRQYIYESHVKHRPYIYESPAKHRENVYESPAKHRQYVYESPEDSYTTCRRLVYILYIYIYMNIYCQYIYESPAKHRQYIYEGLEQRSPSSAAACIDLTRSPSHTRL